MHICVNNDKVDTRMFTLLNNNYPLKYTTFTKSSTPILNGFNCSFLAWKNNKRLFRIIIYL